MNVALRTPWTLESFLAWASQQEGRFEFDGFGPVEVTGGTFNHSQLLRNLHYALQTRLLGSTAILAGPDMAVATVGTTVRMPDALISFTKPAGRARVMPDVVAVFEILSPTTERSDRTVKVREYAAVASINRHVIIHHERVELTVHSRVSRADPWHEETVTGLAAHLDLPETSGKIPLLELYDGVDLETAPDRDPSA